MSWARRMAEKKKINDVLVRCKNRKHVDKRRKVEERNARFEEKHYA